MAYQTLRKRAETEYTEKKSRFIGFAAPVSNAEGALAILDGRRKEHRSASHNCFAYIIGQNKSIIRYSDDGEPSGTAGKPIVEVMLKKNLTNCIVVVTRYFGGVLLGASGLARTYASAAVRALDAAGICTMDESARWHLRIAYPQWDKAEHALQSLPVTVVNKEYTQHVELTLLCRTADESHVLEEMLRITDGKTETSREEQTFYHPWGE
ncbi:MAG: YigZ family protein [Clostridiales bacterium]|nr:YigZ family protein [Clostridiales bacterium]